MSKARKFRNKGKNRNVTGINAAQLREAEEEFKVKVDGDEKLQENINKSIVNKEINQEFDQEASITNERVPSTNHVQKSDQVSAMNNNPVAKPPRNVSQRTVSRAPEPEAQPPARLVSSSEESEDDESLHDMNEGDLQQTVFDLEDRIDDLEMENKKLRAQIELKDLEIEKLQKEARKAERQRNRVGGTRTRATRAKETDL
ncbi:unnamed protein product [Oikopleura dioica]|uniref:Uncharacterized protein n=1 Tax=Oikopleura dioica TaxID=34765 RepID=E4WW96_OIKDI|nr:unnamed protein product [Oikopleura dioica]CBY34286.1 unnamed protein product [Oikopleura dioica]